MTSRCHLCYRRCWGRSGTDVPSWSPPPWPCHSPGNWGWERRGGTCHSMSAEAVPTICTPRPFPSLCSWCRIGAGTLTRGCGGPRTHVSNLEQFFGADTKTCGQDSKPPSLRAISNAIIFPIIPLSCHWCGKPSCPPQRAPHLGSIRDPFHWRGARRGSDGWPRAALPSLRPLRWVFPAC